jgi:hypothetical protein
MLIALLGSMQCMCLFAQQLSFRQYGQEEGLHNPLPTACCRTARGQLFQQERITGQLDHESDRNIGWQMAGDHLKCLEAGMDAYLEKPVDRAKLLQIAEGCAEDLGEHLSSSEACAY